MLLQSQQPASILAALHRHSLGDADRPALIVDRGSGYETLTWRQVTGDIETAAAAFRRLGVERGEHVGLLGDNRYEWLISDLALQLIGAVSVPLHTTLTPPQIAAQLDHGDVHWALVADETQLAKLSASQSSLQGAIVWQPVSPQARKALQFPVYDWRELLAAEVAPKDSLPVADATVEPDQLATVIYTSGTTGQPKGVMLSHGNLAFNAWSTWTSFGNPRGERRFGLLPWSHAFARTCDLYAWIVSGTQLIVGRSRETAVADMQAIRPTYLNGVPYFFQKVQRAIEASAGVASATAARELFGGELRACCSGGAPLPNETFDFYQRQGLPVLEGYGMTEASPVIATCTEAAFRRSSVGRALNGVELRIAEDGEVLTQGRHVMLGYYKDPASTADVIRDGWLHTGDIGSLDSDGFLYLTGRKKELIILSTGRKVAPSVLESLLTQDPLIEQAIVVGDGQKELGALVLLNQNVADQSPQISATERIREAAARLLRDRPSHEQIQRFALLESPLSPETGELSAKQSLCRTVIAKRHADRIKSLFEA